MNFENPHASIYYSPYEPPFLRTGWIQIERLKVISDFSSLRIRETNFCSLIVGLRSTSQAIKLHSINADNRLPRRDLRNAIRF